LILRSQRKHEKIDPAFSDSILSKKKAGKSEGTKSVGGMDSKSKPDVSDKSEKAVESEGANKAVTTEGQKRKERASSDEASVRGDENR
jgi:hypothetical protein